ncbi:MAG: hypothetical protein M3384_11465 [Acidobacteriota bacterium]|nr:hypothetical protein [Acidobacteriota bacterium]
MNGKLFFIAVLTIFISTFAFAQRTVTTKTPTPKPTPTATPEGALFNKKPLEMPSPTPQPTPVTLEIILTEAERQTQNYRQAFNSLLAEETKTFEEYNRDGEAKKRRTVESNFLVYQSTKNENWTTEYRNVVKVDGKAVGDSNKRAEDFFEDVLKSTSPEAELEKILVESTRYDKTLNISGFTLNQSPVLAAHIRPALDFRLGGQETLNGRKVYAITYLQKAKSPYLLFNERPTDTGKLYINYEVELPKQIKEPANPLLRGKLWIDAETFEVLREEREQTIQLDGRPTVVFRTEFEYQKNELGFVTPKKITLTYYEIRRKDEQFIAVKDTVATFEYTKFTKSDVEVKSGDADSPETKNP